MRTGLNQMRGEHTAERERKDQKNLLQEFNNYSFH